MDNCALLYADPGDGWYPYLRIVRLPLRDVKIAYFDSRKMFGRRRWLKECVYGVALWGRFDAKGSLPWLALYNAEGKIAIFI